MKDKKGIMAAITAAVSAYLEEEQRARPAVALPRRPTPATSMWRFSGRDEIMRMRTLWQRRIV